MTHSNEIMNKAAIFIAAIAKHTHTHWGHIWWKCFMCKHRSQSKPCNRWMYFPMFTSLIEQDKVENNTCRGKDMNSLAGCGCVI